MRENEIDLALAVRDIAKILLRAYDGRELNLYTDDIINLRWICDCLEENIKDRLDNFDNV